MTKSDHPGVGYYFHTELTHRYDLARFTPAQVAEIMEWVAELASSAMVYDHQIGFENDDDAFAFRMRWL
jgi:hypothetical protein